MDKIQDCDVCIVGTGAGGGILAYELAQAGFRVVSLEQGGMLPTDQFKAISPLTGAQNFGIDPHTVWPNDPHDSLFTHALFADGSIGSTQRPQGGFQHFQILAVNGLQNLWNGVSVRFGESDFSNWPIGYATLAPNYSAVERLITVCGTAEGIAELPDGIFVPPKPLRPVDKMIVAAVDRLNDPDSHAIPNRKAINTRAGMATSCISTGICTSGCPVGSVYKFSSRLLPEIADLPNYELRTHAKVTRLIRQPDTQRISGVEYLDTATGERRVLRAKIVVLAAGAVETPRILFNSADEQNPAGLGNRNGLLGRGLQDNPKVVLSTSLWRLWGKRRNYDIGYGDLLILLSRGKLPDGSSFPFIGHAIHGLPDVPHYLGGLKPFPPFLKERLARMMFHSYATLGLFCAGEATSGNRVRPGDTVDRYGVPQVHVDFSTPPGAVSRMDAMMAWGRKVLRSASATALHTSRDNSGTGIHYAGTTPISAREGEGIVDANLKVHDMDNLFVCDGGVIPVLPDKHLTLTIMALSHRLGKHIANNFLSTQTVSTASRATSAADQMEAAETRDIFP
ncbi:GMC family oxidoreductase [Paralcaligenes sp. KSB-10]|uniref:GMC oxidoreductase n=1 Tax=Paralcaligenes sp. KSB-10 TaxID=2901142 RepID=UPI001E345CD8|nr:GMC family oxidoreductase [Paralcaligenes sp. KSB-10]UHL65491.1 GMC family oxidoreductase [Paralcaligenes sp. KSB-10]